MEEKEFRDRLTPEQYRILREKDTERAYSGKYWDNEDPGLYTCAGCGQSLFLSLSKVDAGNGWPTFLKPASDKLVELVDAEGKTEICCRKCRSHIGYKEDGKLRANSGALEFLPMPELELPELEKEEKPADQAGQAGQMVTVTLGGLAFGTAVGALVVFLSPPAPACVPEVVEKRVEVPVTRTVTTTVSPIVIKEATTTEAPAPVEPVPVQEEPAAASDGTM